MTQSTNFEYCKMLYCADIAITGPMSDRMHHIFIIKMYLGHLSSPIYT